MSSADSQTRVIANVALAVSIILNSAALILLRTVIAVTASDGAELSARLFIAMLGTWQLWAGGASFVAGTLFWIVALRTIPLSLAYPTAATSYVVIAIAARLLFDEPITVGRVAGMAMIILGVAVLYRRPRKHTV